MSTHFTVPVGRSPVCGNRNYVMPAGLSSYVCQEEYSASMRRIQAANRAPAVTRFLLFVSWMGYMLSLFQICGLFDVSGGVNYGNYYVDSTWLGWSVCIVSFISLLVLGRYSQTRRIAQVTAAVQCEHATYMNRAPALSWRIRDQRVIEISVVDAQQQHIAALEHQVHSLQAQMAVQQAHQAVDHELIAHQAAVAHQYAPPQYNAQSAVPPPSFHGQYLYPTVAAPAVQVSVTEPVVYAQSVYQPAAGSVFAHPPPPQYYAAQPNTMRAPLVQYQY